MTNSSGWAEGPWLGFDTETTGVSPKRDRIVTAAVVWRSATAEFTADGNDRVQTWLADPGIPIPPAAARVHGISTEQARREGRPPAQVVDEVCGALAEGLQAGGTVVVFNAGFDLPLLDAEAKRNGVEPLANRVREGAVTVADPLVLDRALDRYRKGKRTLSDLAYVYGVDVPSDTHQAHVDATLALDLLHAIVAKYPQLTSMDHREFHDFQASAHREWAEGFQRFMRSKGRDVHISPQWF